MGILKVTCISVAVFSVVVWYLHEYNNAYFMDITRNIPYLSPFIVDLHSFLKKLSITAETQENVKDSHELLFTEETLAKYSGIKGSKGIYLSILGKVYDVKKGKKHYQPGGSYHIFAGKDSSKSFVTGEFAEKDVSDDVLFLTPKELLSLYEWSKFYEKEYPYKGKLTGRFYDEKGDKTDYLKEVEKKIVLAEKEKKSEYEDNLQFPPCNIEWSKESGTRVWCSKKSGGINRDWTGVPRKLYQVGSESFRCACINLGELSNPKSPQFARKGHLRQYENCDPLERSCFT